MTLFSRLIVAAVLAIRPLNQHTKDNLTARVAVLRSERGGAGSDQMSLLDLSLVGLRRAERNMLDFVPNSFPVGMITPCA
jgi:hypothetical protein